MIRVELESGEVHTITFKEPTSLQWIISLPFEEKRYLDISTGDITVPFTFEVD